MMSGSLLPANLDSKADLQLSGFFFVVFLQQTGNTSVRTSIKLVYLKSQKMWQYRTLQWDARFELIEDAIAKGGLAEFDIYHIERLPSEKEAKTAQELYDSNIAYLTWLYNLVMQSFCQIWRIHSKKMSNPKYKYNIRHFLSLLPQYWTIEKVAEVLEKHGIPRRTFDRDKSITLQEESDIPGRRLFIYARLFDCSIEQLFNYPEVIMPLNTRRLSKDMEKITTRTTLKIKNSWKLLASIQHFHLATRGLTKQKD